MRQHAIDSASQKFREAVAIQGVPPMFSTTISEQQSVTLCRSALVGAPWGRSIMETVELSIRRSIVLLSVTVTLAAIPVAARPQALNSSEGSSDSAGSTTSVRLDLTYVQPAQRTKARNYVFDAFGPYPAVGAAFAAGINQWTNSPPEWKQGAAGFSKRFGSDFGIAAVSTTTRYGLAQAFREDALYY